jgi:hypothetical protein
MKREYRNEKGDVGHTDESAERVVQLVGDFDLLIIRHLTQAHVIALEKPNLSIDVDAGGSYSEYGDQENECGMKDKQHDVGSTAVAP